MLKTLNKEINPHHGGFTVTARDDNDVQTVGLHTWQNQTIFEMYLHSYFQ